MILSDIQKGPDMPGRSWKYNSESQGRSSTCVYVCVFHWSASLCGKWLGRRKGLDLGVKSLLDYRSGALNEQPIEKGAGTLKGSAVGEG